MYEHLSCAGARNDCFPNSCVRYYYYQTSYPLSLTPSLPLYHRQPTRHQNEINFQHSSSRRGTSRKCFAKTLRRRRCSPFLLFLRYLYIYSIIYDYGILRCSIRGFSNIFTDACCWVIGVHVAVLYRVGHREKHYGRDLSYCSHALYNVYCIGWHIDNNANCGIGKSAFSAILILQPFHTKHT